MVHTFLLLTRSGIYISFEKEEERKKRKKEKEKEITSFGRGSREF